MSSKFSSKKLSAEKIDTLLPQTQCGLCGYKGCMPYAEALANAEAEINLCPPGGVKGLLALGELLERDTTPFLSEMEQKSKLPSVAIIRESECIGCTKCIQACPVDAILGAAKQMHTVITDECTGCELCIAPCPVDCIDMVVLPDKKLRSAHYRKKFLARENRLQRKKQISELAQIKTLEKTNQDYIQAALLRVKLKQK